MHTFTTLLSQLNAAIDAQTYPNKPEGLYEPVSYVLSLGGKRIRPAFLLLAYQMYRDDIETAMPAAIGLETYHNYTLLHDDLMDRADVRRGKPTVHKVWDDNTAILSGDSMLVLAYQALLQCPAMNTKILQLFTKTALEIGEGQQYDMNFEKRTDVSQDEYIEMIRLKTSVLVACATQMGAELAGASQEDAKALYHFGEQIGLAFQLQDDFLDVFGNSELFGKNIGGDILCNKKTFLAINAWQRANDVQRAELTRWFTTSDAEPAKKIAAVTQLYEALGIRDICHAAIEHFYGNARTHLEKVNLPAERKQRLWDFAETLLNRNS